MTNPRWTSPLTGSTVYEADAHVIAATLPDGVASCAILDGPYGIGKAAWDCVPIGGSLTDLYRDHFADLERICAPSASLYLWNTFDGWACLHPALLVTGWKFRSVIIWDKVTSPACFNPKILWPSTAEVCGYYTRGNPEQERPKDINTNVWRMSHQEYAAEKLRLPITETMHSGSWSRTALHPSQKPLAFAERMIRASTRPGDTVWVPFGGTLREVVAAEHIARRSKAEARRVITCELNNDGADYIGPAVAQAEGRSLLDAAMTQGSLFG